MSRCSSLLFSHVISICAHSCSASLNCHVQYHQHYHTSTTYLPLPFPTTTTTVHSPDPPPLSPHSHTPLSLTHPSTYSTHRHRPLTRTHRFRARTVLQVRHVLFRCSSSAFNVNQAARGPRHHKRPPRTSLRSQDQRVEERHLEGHHRRVRCKAPWEGTLLCQPRSG